jgi:hypothetical protein
MLNQILASTGGNIQTLQQVWSATGINVYKKVSDEKMRPLRHTLTKLPSIFMASPTSCSRFKICYRPIPQLKKVVFLVLNCLDSLSNNKVYEKEQAGFTAINLTKLKFNQQTTIDILNGSYNFVYMSPENFLKSKDWDVVYFSRNFQNWLSLMVIDEAHMVYIEGLVASKQGKTAAAIPLQCTRILRSFGHLMRILVLISSSKTINLYFCCLQHAGRFQLRQ